MKKLLFCVLTLALVLPLTSCAPDTAEVVTPTPEPMLSPKLDLSQEPLLDEVKAVPDFLTEEQQLLYRWAGTLYRLMKSGATGAVDFPAELPNGTSYSEGVEINGYCYVKALGKYRDWADFEGLMLSVYTQGLWDSINSLYDGNKIYINVDGTMHFIDLGMDIGSYYNSYFPDEFILRSKSDTEISFLLVGHYVHDAGLQAGESIEERDARLISGYDYTLEFPIQLVLTDNGWRFDAFHDAYCDEREEFGSS